MKGKKDDETISVFSHSFEPGSGNDGLPVDTTGIEAACRTNQRSYRQP
jgi:hypothetical protein